MLWWRMFRTRLLFWQMRLALGIFVTIPISTSGLVILIAPKMQQEASTFPKSPIKGRRVFWEGPLFGRLTKAGREHLERNAGFKRILRPLDVGPQPAQERLSVVWPNKSGPQLELDDAMAAHIRPYPKWATDFLDDKIVLSSTILQRGTTTTTTTTTNMIMPKSISSPDEALPNRLYFVKHRHGAQGKSVYVFDRQELEDWWCKQAKDRQDFLIQDEIVPTLYDDRKFVMRTHILLFQSNKNGHSDGSLVALLHHHVICQLHSVPYHTVTDGTLSTRKAAHISQAGGKKLPAPLLLDNLDPSHPAAKSFPEIEACSKKFVAAIAPVFSEYHARMSPETTCFALLGIDILLDVTGTSQICEVNSHPALGWGTMSRVPNDVFDSLIEESLSILMFGADDDDDDAAAIEDTGFRRIMY